MKRLQDLRANTKKRAIAEHLDRVGSISNVSVMQGEPVRTNRLAGIIGQIKDDLGWKITSITETSETGKYIDCVYILEGRPGDSLDQETIS